MNCKKCGSPLTENDQFCTTCGEPVSAPAESTEVLNPEQPVAVAPAADPIATPVAEPVATPVAEPVATPVPSATSTPAAQPKQNNNVLYIVIGVVVVAALIAGAIIFTSKGKKSDGGSVDGGNTPAVTPTSAKSYKVQFKGYTLSIPDNMIYEDKGTALLIGDENDTWVAQLEIEEGNFATIKANKGQLQQIMQKSGFTSSAAVEKTAGGVEYITLEISSGGQKAIAALAKLDAMHFAGYTIITKDNEYDYKLLDTLAPIISSAEMTSASSNSIAIDKKIDMNKVADLGK